MTENLLQQLEERTVSLLTEVETLRNKVSHLSRENADLRAEHTTHMKKVRELLSLLDTLDLGNSSLSNASNIERLPDQVIYANS